MSSKLNEDTIKNLTVPKKGNEITYFAGDVLQGVTAPRGFGVRVTAGGARSFILNYRIGTQERRYTIGAFPDWSALKAIREAKGLRQRIDRGEDIQAEKSAAKKPAPATKTISDLLDEHVVRYLEKNKLRTSDHIKGVFDRLVKPKIGAKGIYELRRSHVVTMLDEIEDDHGPVMADRTLAYVRKAFNWYAPRDDQFNTPIVRGMARTKPRERARERILEDQEIRDIWTALDTLPRPACYARYIKTLLLTGQRRAEVAKMTWGEISGEDWTIPAARYKTGHDLLVPLTEQARAAIGEKARDAGPFVFSTDGGKSAFGGYSKAKVLFETKLVEHRAKDGRAPMPRWTLHDLRRTARSLMSRAGVPSDHAERVLGHVLAGVRGTYDRFGYATEKRAALDALAALVERIITPPSDNVASLDQERSRRAADAGAA